MIARPLVLQRKAFRTKTADHRAGLAVDVDSIRNANLGEACRAFDPVVALIAAGFGALRLEKRANDLSSRG